MRFLIITILAAGPAAADPGHLSGLAGHDHWVAGIAIAGAIAAAIWGATKGKSADEADNAEEEPDQDADVQEA